MLEYLEAVMDDKLADLYYSPRGYWKGLAAIKHLADALRLMQSNRRTKVSAAQTVGTTVVHSWLKKQAIWQVYLPAPRYVPRPKFDVEIPNEVHQADLLYLPHDKIAKRTYKYALTVVDVASRFKEAEPLTSKTAVEVAEALSRIYKRSPLKWPKLLQVDPGKEFMGAVSQLLAKHGVSVRRGRVDVHRDQGIVERFNRTLAERLFGHQYAQEMLSEQRSSEWVARLSAVVAALNGEVTRLIGKRPSEAIRSKAVSARPAAPARHRPIWFKEQKLPLGVGVRYLYQPGELEGGRRRATDPTWSLTVHRVERTVTKSGDPVVYYLDGPSRGFVREELQVVPPDTQSPPTSLSMKASMTAASRAAISS